MESEAKPLVSILLPIGDTKFLAEVLNDLLLQQNIEWEIVALLNSGDFVASRILSEIVPLNKLKILEFKEKFNLSFRLNSGVKFCTADFIARCDADDRYLPSRLFEQFEFLSQPENLHIVLVGTGGYVIDSLGETRGQIVYPRSGYSILRRMMYRNSIIHSSVMFRKSLFLEFQYDPALKVAQDLDLWLRVLTKHQIANLPSALTGYRVHNNNHSELLIPKRELMKISKRRMNLVIKFPNLFFHCLIGNTIWIFKNSFLGPTSLLKTRHFWARLGRIQSKIK
jgi:glycosyltransferase involved in cell wall biosynthesis